jgi:hypothetical protein
LAVGNIEYVSERERERDVDGYHHSTSIAMEEINYANDIGNSKTCRVVLEAPWKCGEMT